MPHFSAHSSTESRACFLVPTKRMTPPLAASSRTKSVALFEQLLRLQEIDDVDPLALPVDVAAHAGVPAPRLVAEVDSGLQQLL